MSGRISQLGISHWIATTTHKAYFKHSINRGDRYLSQPTCTNDGMLVTVTKYSFIAFKNQPLRHKPLSRELQTNMTAPRLLHIDNSYIGGCHCFYHDVQPFLFSNVILLLRYTLIIIISI